MLASHPGANWCLVILGGLLLPLFFLGLSLLAAEKWRNRLVKRGASDQQLELAFEALNLAVYVILWAASLVACQLWWYKGMGQTITFYVIYGGSSLYQTYNLVHNWREERQSQICKKQNTPE